MGQAQCCTRSQDLHTDDKEAPEDQAAACSESALLPKLKRKKVTFDKRPFGIVPVKEANQSGYIVESVNKKDIAKPAWTLGVRPGWIGLSVNGEKVEHMKLDAIQHLLKEASLPLVFEFSVPAIRSVVLSFDRRPFGMTACKAPRLDGGRRPSDASASDSGHDGCTMIGYEVDSVNPEASRPAYTLGVQPGWVLKRIGKTKVAEARLTDIHRILKEAPLPAQLEFAAPEIPHLLTKKGDNRSDVGSDVSTAAPLP